jgi:hypothetical protein
MKLEQEAMEHIVKKRMQFKEQLREYVTYVESYIDKSLHNSHETEQAKTHLQACVLWAEEAAECHGTKN